MSLSWYPSGRQPLLAGNELPVVNSLPSDQAGSLGELSVRDIVSELRKQYDEGFSRVFIDILTCAAGTTMQQMYANSRPVRSATIQNITTTAATVVSIISSSLGAGNSQSSGTATIGILLNAGSGANTGGGSITFSNIDLSHLSWTATNTSDKISVIYTVSGFSGISKPGTLLG